MSSHPAAAVTNASPLHRAAARAPWVAGAVPAAVAIGAPLVIAGAVKDGYGRRLWRWDRRLTLKVHRQRRQRPGRGGC